LICTLIFYSVPGVLFQEGQRFERLHAIDEQDAVEMVAFVLEDARREFARVNVDTLAVAIEPAKLDLPGARHDTPNVRNAQAALPILERFAADRRDVRVDDHDRLPAVVFFS